MKSRLETKLLRLTGLFIPLSMVACGDPCLDDGFGRVGEVCAVAGSGDSDESEGTTTADVSESSLGFGETKDSEESGNSGEDENCGNGIVEGLEECDENGESSTCNANCTISRCGDGIVNIAAGETCDSREESEVCDLDCTAAECGDGMLNVSSGEFCDDGGESIICDSDCTVPECGDGIVNATAGEQCDPKFESEECNKDCTLATCGDGFVNANEDCDAMGESPTCNENCTNSRCGDGTTNMTSGESCDDAGESALCDEDCTMAECGDGTLNVAAGEFCDEGGDAEGCDGDCTAVMCGDSYHNASAEECDEGVDTATCDGDCTAVMCGDSYHNTSAEECDEGVDTATCDGDCTAVMCGDGYINSSPGANEECDGANLGGADCAGQGFGGDGVLSCSSLCQLDASGCSPGSTVLALGYSPVKFFDFSWAAAPGAESYQLYERQRPADPFAPLGSATPGTAMSQMVPLHYRHQAEYRLESINANGTTFSGEIDVTPMIVDAIGYFKASNAEAGSAFGGDVAISADGSTLAVGAPLEDSLADDSGAVYVFHWNGTNWAEQAHLKAFSAGVSDQFGSSLAISADGDTLVVGSPFEDSDSAGDESGAPDSGAVYVFHRTGGAWPSQDFVKAIVAGVGDEFGSSVDVSADGNRIAIGARGESSVAARSGAAYIFDLMGGAWTEEIYVKVVEVDVDDEFGSSVALAGDGNLLVVGAPFEDSGDPENLTDNLSEDSGAVYVFDVTSPPLASRIEYIKAESIAALDAFGSSVAVSADGAVIAVGAPLGNGTENDSGVAYVFDGAGWSNSTLISALDIFAMSGFGSSLALSGDGNTLAVGAMHEASGAIGIEGNSVDVSASDAGAAYVFRRDGMTWLHQAYVKASNTEEDDLFGHDVSLSSDGSTLAVGAIGEDGNGVGGDQANNDADAAGAVYLY